MANSPESRRFQPSKFFADIDYFMLFAALALVAIGILAIASSGVDAEGFRFSDEYLKQAVWAVTGLVLMVVALSLDLSRLKDYMFFVYAATILLLIYTRVAGKVVNGARAWIGFGSYGIQPSEFAKVATILFLAKYLESSEQETDVRRLVYSSLIIGVPVLLILSQPDFGSAIVFFPILLAMLAQAKVDKRYVFFILLVVVFTFLFLIFPLIGKYFLPPGNVLDVFFQSNSLPKLAVFGVVLIVGLSLFGWLKFKKQPYFWIAYFAILVSVSVLLSTIAGKVMKEYQIMRLLVFVNPNIDPQGAGWNILQSVTAVGSGGLLGKGYMQGSQSHARFIPQQSTDFIFSIIAEEGGFLGSLLVVSLFCFFFYRIIRVMDTTNDRYSSLVCAGFWGMFFFHFLINIGMAIGIMPITGIPLYFISYGGSSLWAAMVATGLMLGISARRYRVY